MCEILLACHGKLGLVALGCLGVPWHSLFKAGVGAVLQATERLWIQFLLNYLPDMKNARIHIASAGFPFVLFSLGAQRVA